MEFRNTVAHENVDTLSMLLLSRKGPEYISVVHLCNEKQTQSLPLTSHNVQRCNGKDSVLSKVLNYILKGWPSQVPKELQPYHIKL